jgi:hypothetical protein
MKRLPIRVVHVGICIGVHCSAAQPDWGTYGAGMELQEPSLLALSAGRGTVTSVTLTVQVGGIQALLIGAVVGTRRAFLSLSLHAAPASNTVADHSATTIAGPHRLLNTHTAHPPGCSNPQRLNAKIDRIYSTADTSVLSSQYCAQRWLPTQ